MVWTDALASEQGQVIRLVAECWQTNDEIKASVKPVALPASHPFAETKGAENCLLLETADGEIKTINGRGAGRWATTEAVIADLFDAGRDVSAEKPQTKSATSSIYSLREISRV